MTSSWTSKLMVWLWWFIRGSKDLETNRPQTTKTNQVLTGRPRFCGVFLRGNPYLRNQHHLPTRYGLDLCPHTLSSKSLKLHLGSKQLKAWTIMEVHTQRELNMKHLPGIFRVNCDTPNSLASLMQKTFGTRFWGDGVIAGSWA